MSVVKKESGFFFRQLCGEFAAESCLYEKVNVSDIEVGTNELFNKEKAEFLKQMKSDDEIWRFCTPESQLDMRGGYSIVRRGKVVAVLTTILA